MILVNGFMRCCEWFYEVLWRFYELALDPFSCLLCALNSFNFPLIFLSVS